MIGWSEKIVNNLTLGFIWAKMKEVGLRSGKGHNSGGEI
jgi:hypothetical protein